MIVFLGDSCRSELLRNLPLLGYEYSRQRRTCHRVARSSYSRTSASNQIRNHHWLVLFIFSLVNWRAQVTCAVFNFRFLIQTATTITFNFIGPVDNGGLPIEAFAVQYKLAGDVWAEKPLQRVWPVGGGSHNQYYDLYDSISHVTHTGPFFLFGFTLFFVYALSHFPFLFCLFSVFTLIN